MLSCLPRLASGSTTNETPGSGSTESVGSINHECMNAMQKLRNEINSKHKSWNKINIQRTIQGTHEN